MGSDTANWHQQPSALDAKAADGVAMWQDHRYRERLERAGLADFDAVMTSRAGHCLRVLDDRENWRFELADPRSVGVYLKRHHVRSAWSWLRAKLGLGPGRTAGLVEARNAAWLSARAIPVMQVVAYGEKLRPDGWTESFVLTEELHGYTQLKAFLRERFPPREVRLPQRDPNLRRLIRAVARLARRFHLAGYNHRDFYCCHFFVRESELGVFSLKLIDLQRVQRRRWFRWRWLVKDLAQLAWSAPADRLSCSDRMAFMRYYLGTPRLRWRDKWLIRAVLVKQKIMQWRLGTDP